MCKEIQLIRWSSINHLSLRITGCWPAFSELLKVQLPSLRSVIVEYVSSWYSLSWHSCISSFYLVLHCPWRAHHSTTTIFWKATTNGDIFPTSNGWCGKVFDDEKSRQVNCTLLVKFLYLFISTKHLFYHSKDENDDFFHDALQNHHSEEILKKRLLTSLM